MVRSRCRPVASRIRATGSLTVNSPLWIETSSTSPGSPNGTMILCLNRFSATVPMTSPTTRASRVDVGILTQSLRDKRFKNRPAALGPQLQPMTDDVPARDVQHHGFEAEVVVRGASLQVRPPRFHEAAVQVQHIALLEQWRELSDPGKDMAKPKVGLVEVATDVVNPLAD